MEAFFFFFFFSGKNQNWDRIRKRIIYLRCNFWFLHTWSTYVPWERHVPQIGSSCINPELAREELQTAVPWTDPSVLHPFALDQTNWPQPANPLSHRTVQIFSFFLGRNELVYPGSNPFLNSPSVEFIAASQNDVWSTHRASYIRSGQEVIFWIQIQTARPTA